MSDHDKRTSDRTPLPGRVVGEVTVFQPMTIIEMSEGGAQVETGFAMHNDSLHEFRLSLDEKSVVVKGRIAYCKIAELQNGGVLYRSGIEFIEPPPHVHEAIREFVAAHRNPASDIIDAELA